jgi:hypothetical protein
MKSYRQAEMVEFEFSYPEVEHVVNDIVWQP